MITVSCVEKWCDAFEFSSSSRSISLVGRGSTAPPRIPCAARCESPYADRHPEKGAETHPKSAQYLTGFESDHIRESPDLSTSYEKHLPGSRYVRVNPLSLWDLQPDTSECGTIIQKSFLLLANRESKMLIRKKVALFVRSIKTRRPAGATRIPDNLPR